MALFVQARATPFLRGKAFIWLLNSFLFSRSPFPYNSSITSSFYSYCPTTVSIQPTCCSSQAQQKQEKMKRAYFIEREWEVQSKTRSKMPFSGHNPVFLWKVLISQEVLLQFLALWYHSICSGWLCTFPFLCFTFIKNHLVWYLQLLLPFWEYLSQRSNTRPYTHLILKCI